MRRRHGFTLIELMVVLAIITVLIAMLLPALMKAREQAKVVQCMSGARQAFFAVDLYCNDYKNFYPPGDKTRYISWHAVLTELNYLSREIQTRRGGCPYGPEKYWPDIGNDFYTPPSSPYCSYGLNGLLQSGWGYNGVSLGSYYGTRKRTFWPVRKYATYLGIIFCSHVPWYFDTFAIYPAIYQCVGHGGGWQLTPTAGRHLNRGLPVILADGHGEFMTYAEIRTWPWSAEKSPIMYYSIDRLYFAPGSGAL